MAFRFFRKTDPYELQLSMAGVKLGTRVLQLGGEDAGLFAAMAAKVGLTGRACAVAEDDAGAAQLTAAAENAGVLVEIESVPYGMLPYADTAFDLVVIRTALSPVSAEQRRGALRETLRVLRPGGRCLIIEVTPRGGLGALFKPPAGDSAYLTQGGAERALQGEGFKATRRLAEREGLAFIEGVKPKVTQD
jgi:ubiquinone/menaquinone biosynthesis C-methylase UbiE